MSSLPNEILEDVLQPLDRWTLDGVQFADGRFLQLILERMTDVCLRGIDSATFTVKRDESSYFIVTDNGPVRSISKHHIDTAHLFSEFVQCLRSSSVAYLILYGLVFAPELATLVDQTPIAAGTLILRDGSCAELTPTEFHKVLQHFSPTSLEINACQLRPSQITNGFIRALSKSRVRRMLFPRKVPADGGSFCATDDAVVDFWKQPDVQVGQKGGAPESYAYLAVYHGRFTKALFKRLIEANAVTKRTQTRRIFVSPVRIDDEDLRDYAQHFLYRRNSGTVYELRSYIFNDPSDDAVDLQVVLHSENDGLEMIRYRRPIPDSDETGSDETDSDEIGSDETDEDEADSDETGSDETDSDATDSDKTDSDKTETGEDE